MIFILISGIYIIMSTIVIIIILCPSVISAPISLMFPFLSDFIYIPVHFLLIKLWKNFGVN